MARSTRIADLLRLVANDASDPHKAVEKSYEWEHARALEVGKWSLAGSTALLAAVATGIFRLRDAGPPAMAASASPTALNVWTIASLVIAGLLLAIGMSSLVLASRVERRFVLTLALVAKMVELRPFLKRAVEDGTALQ